MIIQNTHGYAVLSTRRNRRLTTRKKNVVTPQKAREVGQKTTANTLIKGNKMFGKYEIAPTNKQNEAQLKLNLFLDYKNRGPKTLPQMIMRWLNDPQYAPIASKITEANCKRWFGLIKEAILRKLTPLDAPIDERGKHRKGDYKIKPEIQAFIINRVCDKKVRFRLKAIARDTLKYFESDAPSSSAIARFVKAWKDENAIQAAYNENPTKAKGKYMAAQGNASEKAKYVNHYVEYDSSPADVLTADGKRCTIIAAIDIFSRRCVIRVEESSNSFAISRTLRDYTLKRGVAENIITDNGRDYTSNHFSETCLLLGINLMQVEPYSGDQKAHVERLFGTLTREVFEELPNYIGHSVAEKQAIKEREDFPRQLEAIKRWREQKRLAKLGKDEAEKLLIKRENKGLIVNVGLTMQQLQDAIDNWIEKIYETRIHTGRNMNLTPLEKWSQSPTPPAMIEDPRTLDLLLMKPEVKTVQKSGIRSDNRIYTGVELAEHVGEQVFILLPPELSEIYVYTPNMQFIGIAVDLSATGQSREENAQAKKVSKKLFRQFERAREAATEFNKKYPSSLIETVMSPREAEVIDILTSQTPIAPKRVHETAAIIAAGIGLEARAANNQNLTKKEEENEPELNENGRPYFKDRRELFLWLIANKDKITPSDQAMIEQYQNLFNELERYVA
ncbi:MAG: Mu transposase C-terminal domain-containing protein [Helicobacteraceae bacterium]|jgi:transposase InsO family protein|nr:Mu transposase C-terminal domain-containing protein [Helicobacteraceae bacterium]